MFSSFEWVNGRIDKGGVNFTKNNALRGGAVYADKESTTISVLDSLAAESIFSDHIQECPLYVGPGRRKGHTLVRVPQTSSSFIRNFFLSAKVQTCTPNVGWPLKLFLARVLHAHVD